jgi:UDP-GlcNAc:undecaprenyl-phosphate GlcNAc-1-phosphate transferase
LIPDLLGGALTAAFVSLFACRALMSAGPLDRPDAARKAHTTPTPTSGGIGIAIGFAAGLIVVAVFSTVIRREISAHGANLLSLTAAFAYAFLLVGFWDDARPLNAKLKFSLFAVLSIAAALAVGVVQEFPFGDIALVLPLWLGAAGTALWIFTLVNTVNFMDGANGLAMGSTAVGLASLALIAFEQGAPSGIAISLCAVGAQIGFLYWNFPRGRLFAGDSGALFSGTIAALASLLVVHRTDLSPLVPPILFFPLLADVLLTLAWRAWRRRSLLDGHSEHTYQILMHGGMSHGEVALIYWAAMAACGGLGYLVARTPHNIADWVVLGSLAIAAIILSTVVRRFADRRGVKGV